MKVPSAYQVVTFQMASLLWMFVQLENHLALRSLPNTQPAQQVINKVFRGFLQKQMLQIIILGTAKMAVYVLQMVMAQSAATVGAVTTLHAFQTSFVDYVW